MRRLSPLLVLLLLSVPLVVLVGCTDDTPPTEDDYYTIVTLPIPDDIVLEVGGLALMPDDRLAVSTRRGDIWVVDDPYGTPHYSRFAQGMHEALGLAYRDGSLYATQRAELTRLQDVDADGRADVYQRVYGWPLEGNYHEYSYGPLIRPDGTMLVTLNLAWVGYGASLSKWRGWMLEITPDGTMTPFATGMRSPAGFGFDTAGEVFYGENQGDWIGSGYITHVERGDFVGNPAGLRWTDEPGSPLSLKPEDIPDTGQPLFEVAKDIPELKPPAVWLPHTLMGISTSDILADTTNGAFGPFTGQLFVGDQGHSKIARVFLEKVNGIYQGAAFPFREGFSSGILRMIWGKDGSMFAGMTSRGWSSTGPEPYGLQRLVWTGKTPFEIKTMEAQPDGFLLNFTLPVDQETASDPTLYAVTSFIYHYHSTYGSPPINQEVLAIQGVEVSEDGLQARIAVDGLREGYIHELKLDSLRAEAGQHLLHPVAYYTLNQIPEGEPMKIAQPVPGVTIGTATRATEGAGQPRHQTTLPEDWERADVTLSIGTLPGLKFDKDLLEVPAGSRVALTFNNNDDMLHNLLITTADATDEVAQAAIDLGLQGHEKQYVPDDERVLFHTALMEPETTQTIYFTAPATPGDYVFVCTFPGHALTMRGTLRVTVSS